MATQRVRSDLVASRKATGTRRAYAPNMPDELTKVLDVYSRLFGLSLSQRQLLHHAVLGTHGPALAVAMRIKNAELDALLKLFRARTGRALDQAAKEVNGVIRTRSSRPHPR